MAAGIRKLSPGGGTALYDATYTACRDQMLPMARSGALRKTLILLSDGDDDQSHATLDDAVKMCQRASTAIYTISTNDSPSRDRGDDVLKAMAVATGGRAFNPFRMENVAEAFQSIQEELRSQYSLVYKPADFKADGAFRPIYLVAYDRNYKVSARKGILRAQHVQLGVNFSRAPVTSATPARRAQARLTCAPYPALTRHPLPQPRNSFSCSPIP